jgi:8-oxo-dGTP pyrophosphatase MutT (NUDIX family)
MDNSETEVKTWKRVLSEEIADCRIFQLRRDVSVCLDGGEEQQHTFYCLECTDWVNIIPLTAEKEVLLIEQYRHGIEEVTLEIPGGMVDGDESPQDAAVRELLEETGYAPREVVLLGKSRPNPAIQDNWVHHFLALDIEKKQEPEFDTTEHAVIRFVPLNEISKLIQDEKITHSLVVAGFHRFSLWQPQT